MAMKRNLKTESQSVQKPHEESNVDDGDPYREFGSLPHEHIQSDGRNVITERERNEDNAPNR